ncbi:MAG: hypothetical protein QXN68_05710 [Thermoplasmata archaeon]
MKNYIEDIKKLKKGQKFILLLLSGLFGLVVVLYPVVFGAFVIFLVLIGLYSWFKNFQFTRWARGNGIIFGGRGKGKGLLLNKRINTDKNDKHFCNIYYNKKTNVINIKEYIDSITPIITKDFINNEVKPIKKIDKYEKVNIYWDDVGVYAPNHMDSELKKLYPSLSALLPINRHLYDAYMIITTQDIERPYKLLRELQTDFSVKAVSTFGFGYIWNSLPILRHYTTTKYIYYENSKSASYGMLPFNAKAIVNETLKHGYLTSGQATKEQFEATNGLIRYGRVIQLKKNILYDTRAFHEKVYGYNAKEIDKTELNS